MANVDHHITLDQRLDNLAAYREKPLFRASMGPVLDDLNAIEAVSQTLFTWAQLSNASGILLDRLAELVDIENFNDEINEAAFRAFVIAASIARLCAAQTFDVDSTVNMIDVRRKGVLTIAKLMQVRAFSNITEIFWAFPFTWIVVIPGLVGIEKQLARTILIRAIGATDRLIGITYPEGQNVFKFNGTLEEGWNAGHWAQEF